MSEIPQNSEFKASIEGDFVNSRTVNLIVEAGQQALRTRLTGLKASKKTSKEDIVTQGDIVVSDILKNSLTDLFPGIIIINEEEELSHNLDIKRGLFAIVDPIDGTTNYFNGNENWAVSVGFLTDGDLIAGIIYQPQVDAIFYAEKGKGAYFGNQRIHVSRAQEFSTSIPYFDYPYPKDKKAYEKTDAVLSQIKQIGLSPARLGSQVVCLTKIAQGEGDFFFHLKTKPWDMAAGIAIVQEAGGIATNIKGERYQLFEEDIVLSNGGIDLKLFYEFVAGLGVAPSL